MKFNRATTQIKIAESRYISYLNQQIPLHVILLRPNLSIKIAPAPTPTPKMGFQLFTCPETGEIQMRTVRFDIPYLVSNRFLIVWFFATFAGI